MGNQLAGIAPSQIYPVEHYLTDLNDLTFVSNLGSTRFFKVALAKFKEGLVVIKVFANHDPLLSLKPYREELYDVKNQLANATNCLPFHNALITDRAGFIVRQYVKNNLYDRISTRPFLNHTEKKWLAFQLLCAVSQCHKLNICHGDIKLENVMVTSWNWVFLTDFASFKPTYLPEDNPADYSYFFDTSRRRICYIAPERFINTPNIESSSNNSSSTNLILPGDELIKGELTTAMDVFSTGCSLAELFTEGNPPFDFSQLLSYRTGDYSPWKVLEKIEDVSIREMIRHMLQKDPSLRLSIEEYLDQQRGKAFPNYFYSFLKVYVQQFSSSASSSMYSADDKIARLKKDMDNIIKVVCDIDEGDEDISGKNTQGLVIIVTLLNANLRSLQQCNGKLDALEIMKTLAKYVSSDIILDRLLPYMSFFLNDSVHRVRAAAIRTLTFVLSKVKDLPRSDANIFPEYVFPNLAHILDDSAVSVRMEYAQNIAVLAETALRFLEITQAQDNYDEIKCDADINEASSKPLQISFDKELQALHEMIQQIVSTLLSDHDNMVKQTLLQNGITRLCIVFGLQKANDLLLSHMITFLNHKQDRHLREAFFDSIVGVAVYIGWQSAPILKPLLQQGMSDTEEAVVCKAIDTLTNLTELGLMSKSILYDLLNDSTVFLCHPNLWIRQAAVGFICTVARTLDIVDVHCKVQPLVRPYTKQAVIQLDKELVLLSCLDDPVPRAVFDFLVKCTLISQLFERLKDRQILRSIARPGHSPAYNEIDPLVKPLFRRLQADGMTENIEDKILAMKDYFIKLLHRNTMNENVSLNNNSGGIINLGSMPHQVTRRYAFLNISDVKEGSNSNSSSRKQVKKKPTSLDSPNIVMNKEWQHMFGSSEQKSPRIQTSSTETQLYMLSASSTSVETTDEQNKPVLTESNGSSNQQGSPKLKQRNSVYRYAKCKSELRDLLNKKREQYRCDTMAKESLDDILQNLNNSVSDWHPKGKLVAHLHEHRGAVNRIRVIPESSLFASCSNDGTVRVWDCGRMENRSIANRSRQTYNRQEGEITSLAVCKSNQCLASSSDLCTIHVFHIEMNGPKMTNVQVRMLNPQEDGCVVDMNHVDAGSQSVLAYATAYGSIVGWDLRAPGNAWKFENNKSHGLITSMCIDPRHCWIVAGTSSGSIVCWDLRFQLPISKLTHPSGSIIHRLLLHPSHESLVISAVQNNNEVTIWDMETDARQTTLWASHSPPLSQLESNDNSTRAMYIASSNDYTRQGSSFLITAGTDMRIRYWDLLNPHKSYVIAKAAMDPPALNAVSYRSQLIDGTTVIQEVYGWPAPSTVNNEDIPRRGPGVPPTGHYDTISDIEMLRTSQNFLLSASREGVIKVWK